MGGKNIASNKMTKKTFITLFFFSFFSCKLTNEKDIESLICGNESKTWIWQDRIINGVRQEINRFSDIDIIFFCNGTYGTRENHRNHWAFSKSYDSIKFTVLDRIARANYNSKVINLSNDSLVYVYIINNDTIVDILRLKE